MEVYRSSTVDLKEARALNISHSGVAESKLGRRGVSCCVEPRVLAGIRNSWISHQVGPALLPIAQVSVVVENAQRLSRMRGLVSRQLPASENFIDHAVYAAAPSA